MSVLVNNEDGYFLCHYSWAKLETDNKNECYAFKKVLFDISCPFLFDAQALKISQNWPGAKVVDELTDAKRLEDLSDKERGVLQNASSVVSAAKKGGLLHDVQPCDYVKNNKEARFFVKKFLTEIDDLPSGHFSSTMCTKMNIANGTYLFPKNAECFLSDVSLLGKCLHGRVFDLVVIDPPWRNKMVRRKRKRNVNLGYTMMEDGDMCGIPVGEILSTEGIVAVWCTNKDTFKEVVLNSLFREWNVKHVATWHWAKITQCGEFTSTPGKNKKTFEILLIGRRLVPDMSLPVIPKLKVIVSVPAAIHSFKPPLNEVFEPYLRQQPRCLEIFARSLIPNWTSFGLEACKLQNIELYEQRENHTSQSLS